MSFVSDLCRIDQHEECAVSAEASACECPCHLAADLGLAAAEIASVLDAPLGGGLKIPEDGSVSLRDMGRSLEAIVGPDVPTRVNEKGAAQSDVPVRFDLIDGKALFKMAAVLHTGAEKYGADNWRGIEAQDHLNHLIMHAYAYLAGDRSDEHLSHIMCRAMFAQAVELQEEPDAQG